ncbi:MAG: CHAT domain-containing protein [Sulfuricellaceae bacterium]
MKQIHDVVLELVRPGPAHNQLLSPLTPYVALCGGDSPVSIHIPFEHQQLLTRLQRLRYELDNDVASDAQIAQRQAELQEMGKVLGEVLGGIPTLLAELSRVRCNGGKLAHLRLSLSASELGMVPFETALSPAGFPGSGSPLFLQSHTPVTLTREIRRGHSLPLKWDRQPRILFAFASPPGLAPVPAEAHLKAIRDAIDPWVKIKKEPQQSVDELKKLLTVLPDASLQEIRDLCSRESYTHVHILAHGAPFNNAGDRHFGISLCRNNDKTEWEVVDGESLAIALTGKSSACATQEAPSLVSLATCDSGNVGSVISPGGSIAHGLHAAGIPWVIASQFPLWMKASSLAVSELFSGLLAGEDPRSVLYDLRRRLRTDCPSTHDWASIVAYATVPPDFENQLSQFRDNQMRARLSVKINRLEDLFGTSKSEQGQSQADMDELEAISKDTRATLASWRSDPTEAPEQRLKPAAALRLGMSGASEKRLGIAYQAAGEKEADPKKKAALQEKAMFSYRNSCDYYCQAIEADSSSTWPLTQYLSMNAVLASKKDEHECTPFGIPPEDWWFIATRLAKSEADTPRGAFALTDLVELGLLGCIYDHSINKENTRQQIDGYVNKILQLDHNDPIPRTALFRQLGRYKNSWPNKLWDDLVNEAEAKLKPKAQSK